MAQHQGIEEVLIKPVSASVMFDTLMQVLGRPQLGGSASLVQGDDPQPSVRRWRGCVCWWPRTTS
jgi:two-component system sensor histidine kinase/response regulator